MALSEYCRMTPGNRIDDRRTAAEGHDAIKVQAFDLDLHYANTILQESISQKSYHVFAAVEDTDAADAAFIPMSGSYAFYAGGVFGTIHELYDRLPCRGQQAGN